MKKFYLAAAKTLSLLLLILCSGESMAQTCTLAASYAASDSRCASTGSIKITATGGTGSYQYKVSGPVSTNYTSSDLITGLSSGRYLVTVLDIGDNCLLNEDSVTVVGTYNTPGFTMASTRVSCKDGNDGTITVNGQNFGRAPFSYKIIAPSASKVGTTSVAGVFTGLLAGSYLVQLSDSCGAIQTRSIVVDNFDWSINASAVTKSNCDSISVTLELKDFFNNLSPHSNFTGFLYGASKATGDTTWYSAATFKYFKGNYRRVTLLVKGKCGIVKSVTWNDTAIPAVNAAVSITSRACSTFTASIVSQVNLTAPVYCLYNSNNVLISCGSASSFTALPYGSYCITVTDQCFDTTITRCFTVAVPVPSVNNNVSISSICSTFTATIASKTNLNNANYCLYDAGNNLITCNTTGVFSGLAFGAYCIRITNNPDCYDTVINRCINVVRPTPAVGSTVATSLLTCTTFRATLSGISNFNSAQYCLYTSSGDLVACNTTGVFSNVLYGSYCIQAVNGSGCFDTTITRCFTTLPPRPSVAASVTISNKVCGGFTARITGQANINNPQYCLYTSSNVLVSCNSTGTFDNVPYGSYCINVQNDAGCYDTLITRCFSASVTLPAISLSATKSCNVIGASDILVTIGSGNPNYSIFLYSPTGYLMQTANSGTSTYTFQNVANLAFPLRYKVVLSDACGNKDSNTIAPLISVVNRAITATAQCPSSISPSGFSDVTINITDNNIGGTISPRIIKKNGAVVSIAPSTTSGFIHAFNGLAPATYIFDTDVNSCGKHLYDTLVVRPYFFPNLYGSKAYQCDNESLTVSANIYQGIAPYSYEIFGSSPEIPNIQSGPQSNPVFNINNGTSYSLIRLRVVDGCGNAGLTDASVLPLSNLIVTTNRKECFNESLTMRVDSIENATFNWYRRMATDDSILVATGASYSFPSLAPGDTGTYFCKVVVNNGCLVKYANYIVTGMCNAVLPVNIVLSGTREANGNSLSWKTYGGQVKKYELERSSNGAVSFLPLKVIDHANAYDYSFFDSKPPAGNNFYRVKIVDADEKVKYSNIKSFRNSGFELSFYPNPVSNILYLSFSNNVARDYQVEIFNANGQMFSSKIFTGIQNAVINYTRESSMKPGVYLVSVTDVNSKENEIIKVIYR